MKFVPAWATFTCRSSRRTPPRMSSRLDGFGNLKGLIFDLRGNPGGLLSQAVEVAIRTDE